ncbi:MAG: hypothetical protein UHL07_05265 [Bacteroidaceae bacterium]|nr:hypothetical protein [Bacteroidaceae bacterium]
MDKMLLQAAVDAITAEIEKDTTNANLYRERGRLRFQLGMEREAMEDLRQAIVLNPTLVDEIANGRFEGKIGSCH